MDLNIRDNRLSTPLHWATYSRSETSLNYLLAWGSDIEATDQQGYRPLHLAVKSVEALESTRPVKALLLRGADRNALDKQDRRAIMLADKTTLPENLYKELETIL
jgi:ankyrin repeat protein